MKVLRVTSEVTYVPRNYQGLFEEVLARAGEHISGLILLENLELKVWGQAAGLFGMGCFGIGRALFKNILEQFYYCTSSI